MTAEKIQKELSMEKQKEMLSGYYHKLANAKKEGRKVVYTFVPGNMTELMLMFDALPVYPEINALQSAMRKKSDEYIREAERTGHSEDVCTYVKCDVGMMMKGNIGPTGEKVPEPDLLLLSYTGCFTFMKWFETLRHLYKCPVSMIHVPYQGDGEITPEMRKYVVDQLKTDLIPKMEKITGVKYDEERLKEMLKLAARAEDDIVFALNSAKQKPSPIDSYFGGVYYIGPMFTAFRGTSDCIDYYRYLREEIEERIADKSGPVTPEGRLDDQKYRLVVEGPPNWTHFRDFWKLFYDERAVVVASSYTKVGGIYDSGFRHNPDDPLGTMADYCMGCYTNLNLPQRISLLESYINDFSADGFLINSIKSCNSFSAGQLVMMQELEKRTGKPGGFIESDLVDSRYYSHANIKNRLESYLQMIEQRRKEGRAA